MSEEITSQIERIKKKLILAKDIDKDFKVFGAESHEYILGETVNEDDILEFEKECILSLPESYKAFLLCIGNGGISYQNSAAGPSYGIYPLGKYINEFVYDNPENYLRNDCVLYPEMADQEWQELTKKIDENDDISDEEFDNELGKMFAGVLPIGSQGCSYYYGLVLNGKFKGHVVYIDVDRQKPFFPFESNFLDWYERWLDEITAENTEVDNDLFSYTLGGAINHILDVYKFADDKETKQQCLLGILKKKNVDSQTLDFLEKEYKLSENEIQKSLLQILTKFDYNRAYQYLLDFAEKDLLSVFKFVYWYAKNKSADWLQFIKTNIERINDEETFRFCTYLLKEMNIDYGSIIIPFTTHLNEEIRVTAYYSLGKLENKADYLDIFITGLNDKINRIVHTTLQALDGVKEEKLLKHYKNIAERFPVEQDYVLVNLNHRLKDYGLTNKTILTSDFGALPNKRGKKWYIFWK
ncbi:SMI1/KNR4 family protein [Flavobacterium sp. LPB0248]|uniref:SMI1/KNR4 family protein n=1 Tax=Flavobacterium sp. LPB0248 TaxID=2614441 RepID=UPI0015A615EB|nr:SMI1/KNR4 family protein [Flavobacterium sp. LPB0248]QLC65278.1 SMI1/KNR4 family protein [Flavobacterium sp. LPB0248]